MNLPAIPPAELEEVIREVTGYVLEQRRQHHPLAAPLTAAQKQLLQPFFSAAVLQEARVRLIPAASFPNPAFFYRARARGFQHMPDYSHLREITFQDVVLLQEPSSDRLLFHGLVHVVQCRVLGLECYVASYLRGFCSTGRHVTVPLEVQAFGLDERFAATPSQAFSVESEVEDRERQGRF